MDRPRSILCHAWGGWLGEGYGAHFLWWSAVGGCGVYGVVYGAGCRLDRLFCISRAGGAPQEVLPLPPYPMKCYLPFHIINWPFPGSEIGETAAVITLNYLCTMSGRKSQKVLYVHQWEGLVLHQAYCIGTFLCIVQLGSEYRTLRLRNHWKTVQKFVQYSDLNCIWACFLGCTASSLHWTFSSLYFSNRPIGVGSQDFNAIHEVALILN